MSASPSASSPPASEELVALAKEARKAAYAPYSKYQVGCALTTEEGGTFTGGNVENASYGLAVCAERNAISQAVLAGHREISQLVVVTQSSPPAAPCGLCRQTINEFCSNPDKLVIHLVNLEGQTRSLPFQELFPYGFRGESLK